MPIPVSALDTLRAIQLTVAWAGEGRCEPRRLGWWDTDIIDRAGGGDLLARLLPRTHAWAALEAARRADSEDRRSLAQPDLVRTLFFFGFEADELIAERPASLKRSAEPPARALPWIVDLEQPFSREGFAGALKEPGRRGDLYDVLPRGRQLRGPVPPSIELAAKHLAAGLVPLPDRSRMPRDVSAETEFERNDLSGRTPGRTRHCRSARWLTMLLVVATIATASFAREALAQRAATTPPRSTTTPASGPAVPRNPVPVRTLEQLTDTREPAWPALSDAIAHATNTVEVLPLDRGQANRTLVAIQVTTRSTLGAIAHETGGILVDHGWIKLLGGGGRRMQGTLANWNGLEVRPDAGPPATGFMIVGFDALGGVFALDGGGLGPGRGNVFYFAVDTLAWEDLGVGYSQFIAYLLTRPLDARFGRLRWAEWQTEVAAIAPDQGISVYPFPSTREGRDVGRASRRPVAMIELFRLYVDAGAQSHPH